jgi:5'-nucleotidase (lipoprotein e(P4) family)
MKRFCLLILLAVIVFISPVKAEHIHAKDPQINIMNLEKSYTLEYEHEFNDVIDKAKLYADKHYVDNAVIVSDIDETILDNRDYYRIYGEYTTESWNKFLSSGKSTLHNQTYHFFKWAKDRGYKIFLITGRTEPYREATLANLKKYNIPFDGIYFKPENYDKKSVADFKKSIRKKLSDEGYKVIINIGDQKSDLKGGYGKGFKLPNIIYTTP